MGRTGRGNGNWLVGTPETSENGESNRVLEDPAGEKEHEPFEYL
jgi:hypothetical protein